MTDRELVLAARGGDASALGLLLERHRASLYARAVWLLRDREAARDAVQETFVVALERIGALTEPAAAGGWLHAIVGNVCLMRLRRGARELLVEPPDTASSDDSPEEALEQLALRDWVWRALEAMPEDERLTLVLRHFTQASSYEEIASLTGVAVGTVRSRLHRARGRLAEALLQTAAAACPDHGALERARLRELSDFYTRIAQADHTAYDQLFAADFVGHAGARSWRGIDSWAAAELGSVEHGVKLEIRQVLASRDLTILEADFINPPDDPDHCPGSTIQVHHRSNGRTVALAVHYPAGPRTA